MRKALALFGILFCTSAHAGAFKLVTIHITPETGSGLMTLPTIDVDVNGESAVYAPKIKGHIEFLTTISKIEVNQTFDSIASMKSYATSTGCNPSAWGPAKRVFRAYMTHDLNRLVSNYGVGTGEKTIEIELPLIPQLSSAWTINIKFIGDPGNDYLHVYCRP